jgi:hypothetical protein
MLSENQEFVDYAHAMSAGAYTPPSRWGGTSRRVLGAAFRVRRARALETKTL